MLDEFIVDGALHVEDTINTELLLNIQILHLRNMKPQFAMDTQCESRISFGGDA